MTSPDLAVFDNGTCRRPKGLYRDLWPLCLTGLKRAINPANRLYDRQLRHGRWAGTLGTESFTSTCICLIGIDRAGIEPRLLSLDRRATLAAATELAVGRNGREYLRSAGLLIWTNALLDGESYPDLVAKIALPETKAHLGTLTTMQLAWLLSGLVHERVRQPSGRVANFARAVAGALQDRFVSQSSLIAHAGPGAPMADRVRWYVPNFADQIYAVQALAFFAMVFDDAPARTCASHLVARLITLQGPLGQWWWHYNVRTGTVAEKFAVYSVHQYGMAPMALMALQAAGGPDCSEAIEHSQRWIERNELGVSLVDTAAMTVWRDIELAESRVQGWTRKASLLLPSKRATSGEPPTLIINHETRPYEWAWCVYAGAIESGLQNRRHVV
jgi:hypothetical protein